MSKEKINIGIVSKGRLKEQSEKILAKKKLKIFFDQGERELIGRVKGRADISILFLHAREVLEQLAIGNLDIGISGLDLLKESEINIQKNIKLEKKLNFGYATLILACRNEFIDLFTTLDLDDLDTLIRSCLENGANYQDLFFLTGYDTLYNLKGKLSVLSNSLGQFDLRAQGAASLNGVAGEAGLNFDTRVGYYDGIPIFVSQHVTKDTASKIYLLDKTAMALRIAAPTTYVDNTNLAVRQVLSREYAFITAGELVAYKRNTSGSIRDLTA